MGQIAGSIDAAIELIGRNFNLDQSTTMFVSSVAALASVVFGLVVGMIADKKVSFKAVAFFAGACVLIGGLVPFFVDNYIVLLVFRAVYGIGYGGMMSLENTFANLTLPKEKIAFALGLGMFVGYGTNCVLQLIGGFLAEMGWNYVFLNNILLLIPFVLLLICCPNIPGNKEAKAEEKAEKKQRASYPPVIFIMCVLMAFVGLLISPLLIGCSFLSNNIIPDNTTVAGIVAVCFSLGCMCGGLVYPTLSKKLGRFSFTGFLILAAIGALGSALARNIVLLCVMIFIAGMGFAATQSGAMMVTGVSVSKSSVAMVSSLIMACFNIGMFLCSPFQSLVGSIPGCDQLYVPLYIGAAVFVFGAVFFAIYNPFAAKKAANAE